MAPNDKSDSSDKKKKEEGSDVRRDKAERQRAYEAAALKKARPEQRSSNERDEKVTSDKKGQETREKRPSTDERQRTYEAAALKKVSARKDSSLRENKKQKDTWESDEYRFGYVESIKDLERDAWIPGPTISKHERDRLLEKSDYVGYFETEGSHKGGLGAPIDLGKEIMKDGGPNVEKYQDAYNSLAVTTQYMYRAMGRLKDLSMSNAPLTPAELENNSKLMAPFENLKLSGPQDAGLTAWSQAQSNMETHIKRFGAGKHLLAGALAEYASVQQGLEAKRLNAKKDAKLAEITKIDEVAQRLNEMVHVAKTALAFAGSPDVIGSVSLDEHAAYAEVDVDIGANSSKVPDPINWERGTADDPSGANTNIGTRKQKVGRAIDTVTSETAEARRIGEEAKTKLADSTNFDLSIKGGLTAIVGGEKYVKLKKDVVVLESQIRNLGLAAEADTVKAATEKLLGFKESHSLDREQITFDRGIARDDARNFARMVGAGDLGTLAMYAAEASQERAAFGELALRELNELRPLWGRVRDYINTTNKERFMALGISPDARSLAKNLRNVDELRDYLLKRVPEWKADAQQWSDFFGKHAHHDLVHKDNAADKGEHKR
jgi:hypothetical protein